MEDRTRGLIDLSLLIEAGIAFVGMHWRGKRA